MTVTSAVAWALSVAVTVVELPAPLSSIERSATASITVGPPSLSRLVPSTALASRAP